MARETVPKEVLDWLSTDLVKAVSHPLRQKILGEVTRQSMSPNQFRLKFGLSIHNVSYHFRQLEKAGCIEVIDEIQRRGAVEHIYAAKKTALFDAKSWAAMPRETRLQLSVRMLKSMLEVAGEAILAGTFAARSNHHVAWNQEELDDEGWDELQALFQETFERIAEISADSKSRIELGADSMRGTWGLMTFESPPLSGPTNP